MDVNKLLEISEDLGLKEISAQIQLLSKKITDNNCPLTLPLVGEFSSGKTTLINALTDSKQLETATKPTTATIYAVHFGREKCCATVTNPDGTTVDFENVSDLKNDTLADSTYIDVFDTSTVVPRSIVLVDTPGLSSPDPRHKQTLVDFIPQADGILLVSDINQQITRSLTDFIKTMELSQRRIYLVLTKCDTKAESELQNVKKYIAENIKLPMNQVVCVSATKGNIQELISLLASIQKDKSAILNKVNEQRLKNISGSLLERINELLNATQSDDAFDKAYVEQKTKLDKLKRNIERLVNDVHGEVDDVCRQISRNFEDTIFDRLDALVAGKSDNFDSEAVSIINSTTSLLVSECKDKIQDILREKANSRRNTDDAVQLTSFESVDLNDFKISGLSYNLNLNNMGHEYDGLIASGVKIVGTVAAGVVAGYAVGAGAALDAADTVSDLACDGDAVISKIGSQATNTSQPGIVQSLVGLVTDSTMGKPQRRRAIRNYMDGSLVPSFNSELKRNSESVLRLIKNGLNSDAQASINAMQEVLNRLNAERTESKAKFEKRISDLKSYKTIITNFN